ncbi:helix-turn-helix transcriptional regulator [Streptomyces sp. NPDC047000]|uniref:helix-turn-helix transcriptional regulator n=1 Tax=Streptomyces sp. NPDC047000 TaxID=3155474 RepID=UPI003407FE74
MDELGDALRTWRERLDPAALGLAHSGTRRTPGLRREELAFLAGISIDYVVRLEQGRASSPSAQVCAALARALQLTDEEQAHLLRLAGRAEGTGRVPRLVPANVQRIVDQLAGAPVALYDATWHLLHWNALFAATFGDPTAGRPQERNPLIRLFESGMTGVRYTPEGLAAFEKSLVGDLRTTTSRYPRDPDVAALVERLGRSARFRELWALGSVAGHKGASKTIEHPEVGDIDLDSDTLVTQGSDLRIVVYAPRPGTDARSKLGLLAAIGSQRLTARGETSRTTE